MYLRFSSIKILIYFFIIATLPFYEMSAAVKEEREKELRERKKLYEWDYVSPDLPGSIKAANHAALPRDVQFTDEKSR